ncbi:hypothetical protein T265_09153 [Opisthorchis viverrini]|uniref:Secreted protein n=1 Tax=Opisthorchis viverrini TaxID=6198 RepID=A0A074ZHS2_OPIVI|nr:hypothetical protein T265_09153 [Opisthorchis viverrini]KER22815.1 hypothetical protein T265_09153 [Opisthorchis viverrini]
MLHCRTTMTYLKALFVLVTDSPTPTHTSYGSETTIVEHLKTSQFRCSNRPSLTAIQQNSPYSGPESALLDWIPLNSHLGAVQLSGSININAGRFGIRCLSCQHTPRQIALLGLRRTSFINIYHD